MSTMQYKMDATMFELASKEAYQVFREQGHKTESPPGYKVIIVHLIYDVKLDDKHKARLVAYENLTDIPDDNVYLSVVPICKLHFLLFLAELNGLKVWDTYIGTIYQN